MMKARKTPETAAPPGPAEAITSEMSGRAARAAYVPPRIERLGAWSALTLQQSVPIGPGNF